MPGPTENPFQIPEAELNISEDSPPNHGRGPLRALSPIELQDLAEDSLGLDEDPYSTG